MDFKQATNAASTTDDTSTSSSSSSSSSKSSTSKPTNENTTTNPDATLDNKEEEKRGEESERGESKDTQEDNVVESRNDEEKSGKSNDSEEKESGSHDEPEVEATSKEDREKVERSSETSEKKEEEEEEEKDSDKDEEEEDNEDKSSDSSSTSDKSSDSKSEKEVDGEGKGDESQKEEDKNSKDELTSGNEEFEKRHGAPMEISTRKPENTQVAAKDTQTQKDSADQKTKKKSSVFQRSTHIKPETRKIDTEYYSVVVCTNKTFSKKFFKTFGYDYKFYVIFTNPKAKKNGVSDLGKLKKKHKNLEFSILDYEVESLEGVKKVIEFLNSVPGKADTIFNLIDTTSKKERVSNQDGIEATLFNNFLVCALLAKSEKLNARCVVHLFDKDGLNSRKENYFELPKLSDIAPGTVGSGGVGSRDTVTMIPGQKKDAANTDPSVFLFLNYIMAASICDRRGEVELAKHEPRASQRNLTKQKLNESERSKDASIYCLSYVPGGILKRPKNDNSVSQVLIHHRNRQNSNKFVGVLFQDDIEVKSIKPNLVYSKAKGLALEHLVEALETKNLKSTQAIVKEFKLETITEPTKESATNPVTPDSVKEVQEDAKEEEKESSSSSSSSSSTSSSEKGKLSEESGDKKEAIVTGNEVTKETIDSEDQTKQTSEERKGGEKEGVHEDDARASSEEKVEEKQDVVAQEKNHDSKEPSDASNNVEKTPLVSETKEISNTEKTKEKNKGDEAKGATKGENFYMRYSKDVILEDDGTVKVIKRYQKQGEKNKKKQVAFFKSFADFEKQSRAI